MKMLVYLRKARPEMHSAVTFYYWLILCNIKGITHYCIQPVPDIVYIFSEM